MPQRRSYKINLVRLTHGRAYQYPWVEKKICEGNFTASMNTCYADGKTFMKVKGGTPSGGNYMCTDTGEEYRISKW